MVFLASTEQQENEKQHENGFHSHSPTDTHSKKKLLKMFEFQKLEVYKKAVVFHLNCKKNTR